MPRFYLVNLFSGRLTALFKMLLANGVVYTLDSYNLSLLINTSEFDQPVLYLARGYSMV